MFTTKGKKLDKNQAENAMHHGGCHKKTNQRLLQTLWIQYRLEKKIPELDQEYYTYIQSIKLGEKVGLGEASGNVGFREKIGDYLSVVGKNW